MRAVSESLTAREIVEAVRPLVRPDFNGESLQVSCTRIVRKGNRQDRSRTGRRFRRLKEET